MLKKNGFTLVEIIVVMVIISVLVAIAVPNYFNFIEQGAISAAKDNLLVIKEGQQVNYFNKAGYCMEGNCDTLLEINTHLLSNVQDNYFHYKCVLNTDASKAGYYCCYADSISFDPSVSLYQCGGGVSAGGPGPGCAPNNSCAASTCVGSSCTDSCGNSYSGTKICSCAPDCSCAVATCTGSTCTDPACGTTCSGTKICGCTPDCSCAAATCTGNTCTDPTCGTTCGGTKTCGCAPNCSCSSSTCSTTTCTDPVCGTQCTGTMSCSCAALPTGWYSCSVNAASANQSYILNKGSKCTSSEKSGSCQAICASPYTYKAGECCSCPSSSSEPCGQPYYDNCGNSCGFGMKCDSGKTCSNGTCACPTVSYTSVTVGGIGGFGICDCAGDDANTVCQYFGAGTPGSSKLLIGGGTTAARLVGGVWTMAHGCTAIIEVDCPSYSCSGNYTGL